MPVFKDTKNGKGDWSFPPPFPVKKPAGFTPYLRLNKPGLAVQGLVFPEFYVVGQRYNRRGEDIQTIFFEHPVLIVKVNRVGVFATVEIVHGEGPVTFPATCFVHGGEDVPGKVEAMVIGESVIIPCRIKGIVDTLKIEGTIGATEWTSGTVSEGERNVVSFIVMKIQK